MVCTSSCPTSSWTVRISVCSRAAILPNIGRDKSVRRVAGGDTSCRVMPPESARVSRQPGRGAHGADRLRIMPPEQCRGAHGGQLPQIIDSVIEMGHTDFRETDPEALAKLPPERLNAEIARCLYGYQTGGNSQGRRAFFKRLVLLKQIREDSHGIPANQRRFL